jgi:hypothetical protein
LQLNPSASFISADLVVVVVLVGVVVVLVVVVVAGNKGAEQEVPVI